MTEPKRVRITQIRSQIGRLPSHRATIRALGLKKIGRSVEKTADPPVLGMIRKVSYLLKVEEL
ncbi:MAG: 50S ribosomal protein L30 [Deltaproteobacteria bacterium]|jgi:large subunit ribosomal protein L30|nr:50S ribosomal protein L30 [Deltaproteobacteria bacterium]